MTTEAKHTPGPWQAGGPDGDGKGSQGYVYSDNALGSAVAIVYGKALPFSVFSHDEEVANARLIAAAPDLLESLRHAVQIIKKYVPADVLGTNSQGGGDGFNDQSWPMLDEYLHYMNEAIAKATGE